MSDDDDDDDEYCAVCEDPEFGEDGKETHADEDEYDHDFVYEKDEEEGDEGLTLDDVKNVADTIKSIAEAGEAVKKVTKTETPRPLHDEPHHTPWLWDALKIPRKKSIEEDKLDRIGEKIDKSEKHQNRKWYIGIGFGILVAIIIALVL